MARSRVAVRPVGAVAHCAAWTCCTSTATRHRGEETPRRFELGGHRVEVLEVVGRWYGPDHRYIRVRGNDGVVYILPHDEPTDRWEIVVISRDP